METRLRLLFLACASIALGGCASLHWPWHHKAPPPAAATSTTDQTADATPPTVIEPEVERRQVKVPAIKAHNLELGAYYGEISIEDFGTSRLLGYRADYHVTEDIFFEGTYGQAKGGETSYELLNGNVQLLTEAERRFTYYDLSLGYNFLPGEVFIGKNLAMTSALYMIGGIGAVKFAGDQDFSVDFGAGYRVLPTDWLAIHLDMKDLVFRTNIFGVNQLKNNLQVFIGATVFF
jgi:outer membrane beta-barrel protein